RCGERGGHGHTRAWKHPAKPTAARRSWPRWSSMVLFDDSVRPSEDGLRNRQPQGLGGLQVDDQVELRRLLDREVCWIGALENLVDVDRCPAAGVSEARGVVHESACFRPSALSTDERHAVLLCEVEDPAPVRD